MYTFNLTCTLGPPAGETEDTLRPGRLVEARVRAVGRDQVYCSLVPNGADAAIARRHLKKEVEQEGELRNYVSVSGGQWRSVRGLGAGSGLAHFRVWSSSS